MIKWKLTTLIILATILLTPVITAKNIDTCEDMISPGTTCTAITPPLNCNYYQLYHINGTLLNTTIMKEFNGSMYLFNFSQPTGEYIIKLCDNTTAREFVVGEDTEMGWIAIIVALSVMTFIFLIAAINIKERKLDGLKGLLWLLSITNGFMIGATTYIISLHPEDASTFQPIGIGYLTFSGACFIAFIYMYARYLIQRAAEQSKELK